MLTLWVDVGRLRFQRHPEALTWVQKLIVNEQFLKEKYIYVSEA